MSKPKMILVMRHFNLVEMSQEDPEVKAWLGESFRAIGPYFKHKTTATGLSFEEQKYLLPEVLGVEPEDRNFRAVVTKFYDEMLTKVPKDGLKLNIGLEDDTKQLSPDNKPVAIMDYLRYRHLKEHPEVAESLDDAEKLFIKRFYIYDPEGASQSAIKLNETEDKAFAVYSRFKDDTIKIDQILTMLGVNIKDLKADTKVLKLKSFATKKAGASEIEQVEVFDRFIKIAEDKDLEYKYLIQEMIGAQYLKRVGSNIVYNETGIKIGDNMDDAVLYFKNAKNSRDLNLLRSQYQLKVKKGDSYLPKEEIVSDKTE